MPRVTSPWPTLVGMRTLRQRKGKELNNSHTTAEVDLEPLASHFLVQGCFFGPYGPAAPTISPHPQHPHAGVTIIIGPAEPSPFWFLFVPGDQKQEAWAGEGKGQVTL